MTTDRSRPVDPSERAFSPTLVTFPRHQDFSRFTNLPEPVTSFVGREEALTEVKRLLSGTRLLTLTGVGGIGKTRLAIQVARQLLPRFDDGVWLVDLAPLADPTLVPQALALVLEIRQHKDQPLLATLASVLQTRQLLLVLDNCEHVVAACAEMVSTLLRAGPGVVFLVTSREGLGVEGESIWPVPPLSAPPLPGAPRQPRSPTEQPVEQYEAVQLFLERARAVRPHARLTNQRALAELCARLDGLPLALELAAARIQALSLEQVVARLGDRFTLLTGGSRLAFPRQQTLHATLEWSDALLEEPERVLLRRVAVFAGGWTLEAAEMVCAGNGLAREAILDRLTQLVKKSLVVVEEQGEQVRYRLLETVRQYGREHLEAAGELAWVRGQHLAYFLALVEQSVEPLYGAEQVVWMRQLEQEHDNLRAAFEWALESAAWEEGLRLAGELLPFWVMRSLDAEGTAWLEEALSRAGPVGRTPARAQALMASGTLILTPSPEDLLLAQPRLEEALSIWQEVGNQRGAGYTLSKLAQCAIFQGDHATSRRLIEEAQAQCEQAGFEWRAIWILNSRAMGAMGRGAYEQARQRFEQALARARALGNPWCLGLVLSVLGQLNLLEGDEARAEACYTEALRFKQEIGDVVGSAFALSGLALLARSRGEPRRAFLLALEALNLVLRWQVEKPAVSSALLCLAGAVLALQEARLSAQLYGSAEAFRARYDLPLLVRLDQVRYERELTLLQAQLDEETRTADWAAGRHLSPEQALALAGLLLEQLEKAPTTEPVLTAPLPAIRTPRSGAALFPLTRREREVLRLLASGLTNNQIAERLVISPRTVNIHVVSLYNKLGVNNRSAATRLAVEQHLL